MKILIVNTSERTGGAAVAANRLKDALNKHGEKAKMLVRDKETDDLTVVELSGSMLSRWRFLWERWCIFVRLHFSRRHLFELDIANTGVEITSLPEFKEADVIHLHWINQGMLSLNNVRNILLSGKPVVWTMHDMWPATAICHLTLGCRRFQSACQQCKYLPGGGSANDLAARVWRRKQQLFEGQSLIMVACSRWLSGEAKRSALLNRQRIEAIPNAIDTSVFKKTDQSAAREALGLPTDKLLVLFVSQRATNVNKGMGYLAEACRKLVEAHPVMKERVAVMVLGGHAEEVTSELALPAYPLGYVSDPQRIVQVYNAADVFVLPSLSENLPNTIMEAMACGVPCLGFKVGGIPEMIEHKKTGYVAQYKSCDDLSAGLYWLLAEADRDELSAAARRKVCREYSQDAVALRYTEVYNEVIAMKHYKL